MMKTFEDKTLLKQFKYNLLKENVDKCYLLFTSNKPNTSKK